MPKYAVVVVDSYINEVQNNNVFDYIIPDKFIDIIKTGIRVIVPFGKNRMLEGYIIEIRDYSEVNPDKLKAIAQIPDLSEIFNIEQIELAKWMCEEYMCSMKDAIQCIMPTDIKMKENKFVVLNNIEESTIFPLNSTEKAIVDIIKENKGKIALNKLNKIMAVNIVNTLRKMISSSIIYIESSMIQNVKDKFIKIIKLNITVNETDSIINSIKKNKALISQIKVLEILKEKNCGVSQKELVETYGCSRSSIVTLINKGIILSTDIIYYRDPYYQMDFDKTLRPVLTYEQQLVLDNIKSQFRAGNKSYLIHGVTGSGKTEVYMNLIESVIMNGKQGIMLVPEISLTPQTIERFKGRFDHVAVIHSKLSAGEKYDEWKRIREGKVDVVVGVRSAVFAPLKNLGIIIIDEEHENSYKSDITPKYHARDVAYKRCSIENAMLVLGSATPCIETYYEAQNGKYIICNMQRRVENRKMPQLQIVDMREEIITGNRTIFSRKLYEEITKALKTKNQIILFLNRRGFSTFVSCRKCGLVMKCPKCDVSLTYHMDKNMLNCHYCGYSIKSPNICPSCKSNYIKYFGVGTQKIESEVKKYFPDARVLRMDMDTTSRKGSHFKIYNEFKNRDADILIGTQMISKGLDFPGVTLVGIIAADQSLNIPDFKACERTFELITQVAGRAGRGSDDGKVIVQTYDPEHYSIKSAVEHDYLGFYNKEILIRKTFKYPPFSSLVSIIISSKIEQEVISSINIITAKIKGIINPQYDMIILGPSPAPIPKINSYYRWQTIVKGIISSILKSEIQLILNETYLKNKNVKINVDIHPMGTI